MVRSQERGTVYDKRPRHFGSFSGDSSGGMGTFGRGHPHRPFQSALQEPYGDSGSRGLYVSHPEQLAYSSPQLLLVHLRSRVIRVVIQVDTTSSRVSSYSSRGLVTLGEI